MTFEKVTDIQINNKEVSAIWLNNTKIWERGTSLGE